MLKKIITRIPPGSFKRHVLTLLSGTVLAQFFSVLALPLLTRLYTPEQFGTLGVFSAILTILIGIACLRYEIAIPLPEADKEAAGLLVLSLLCTLAISTITAILILFFGHEIVVKYLKMPMIWPWLWLLPVSVIGGGGYNAFQYWLTRKKFFSLIARTRIEQSIAGLSSQLVLGLAGFGASGLILGQVANNVFGLAGLVNKTRREDGTTLKTLHHQDIRLVAIKYQNYPKFSTIDTIANTAGSQLPLILVATLTTSAEVGFLMLAVRILQAPIALIGASVSQAFYSRASIESRNGKLSIFTGRTIASLVKVGVGPLTFFGVVSATIFGPVLGKEWIRTGELIAWLVPSAIFQLLSSPVSMVFHIKEQQKLLLLLTVGGFAIRVFPVIIGHYTNPTFPASEIYAISNASYYAAVVFIAMNVAGMEKNNIIKTAKEVAALAIIFFTAGMTIIHLVQIVK